VSPVKYELGFYIPEDDILHSHRPENLRSYMVLASFLLEPVFPGFWRYEDTSLARAHVTNRSRSKIERLLWRSRSE
jgi:hypothetical protein